jgi:AmmeMemoRadiSam system protein A
MMRPPNDILPQDLARLSVETYISMRIVIEPPDDPKGVLSGQAGAFVTLRTSEGRLRGCVGTIKAARPNVAEEIVQNAINAATRDPRFPPLATHELPGMLYGVDLLSIPEPVSGPEELDPASYGVIVETLDGYNRGLLLPRLHGIESVEQQWLAVHSKAGIKPGTPVRVERFSVTRFGKD